MIDPESSKELISETKAIIPEVYKDIAKPSAQEIGSVTGRTVKALLSPIRGMLWGWEQIEKLIEEGVQKRIDKIPEANRKTPEPEIAVPTIEALRYTAQNETLREMYLNLLGNSIDDRKENIVHPSFVELIKQLNTLDAKLFEKISSDNTYQRILNPTITIKNIKRFYPGAVPNWYAGWTLDGYDEFDVSASFIRLNKFGLIELMHDRSTTNHDYEDIKNTMFLKHKLNFYQKNNPTMELEIGGFKSVFIVNEYGFQFKEACT